MQPKYSLGLLLIMGLLAACGGTAVTEPVHTPVPILTYPEPDGSISATALPGNLDQVAFIEDGQAYTISQLLPRDGIMPIYDPQFVSAEQATLAPDELVMGLVINDDARAYPVGVLRSREMVNDVVGGSPVLVSW